MCDQHLDNIAEVSSIVAGQEVTRTKISPEARKRQQERYLLRSGLQDKTTKRRLCNCGRVRASNAFTPILRTNANTGSSYLSGVQHCGYAQYCPVCGAKVANVRAKEIGKAVDTAFERGNGVYMLTFTVPHEQEHTLKELRELITGAYSYVNSGRAWLTDVADFDILGQIRATEVTNGYFKRFHNHGWHPHLHLLIFTDKPLENPGQLHSRLFARWQKYVVSQGYDKPTQDGTRLDPITTQRGVGRYLSKLAVNVGNELTRSDLKKGRNGGATIWEVLWTACATDDPALWALWFEWESVMDGVQLCRWSNGLKQCYGINELTDQEIAEQEEAFTHSRSLTETEWELISKDSSLIALLLSSTSTHGLDGAESFFEWLAQKHELKPA